MSPPDLTAAAAAAAAPPPAIPARPAPGIAVEPAWWLAAASLPWLLLWLVPPLNFDVAALLLFTDRWLAGAVLYRDLIDVNPPLVFVLYALPAGLSRLTGVPLGAAFMLWLLAFLALVLAMTVSRLARLRPDASNIAMFAGLLPFAIFGLGNSMAGQREQLLALAALPWLIDAAIRAGGEPATRRGVPAALLAALFLCLKPHFAAMPLLIELWLLHRRGRAGLADPVPWCFAGSFALYGATIALLFPAYLTEMLPLILGSYAAFGDRTALGVLFSRELVPVLLVFLACLPLAWRARDDLATILALATLGALFGAVAQAKGWPYHKLPAEMLTALLAGRLSALWLARHAISPVGFAAAALVAGNAFALATREGPWRQVEHGSGPVPELAREIRARAPGQAVLILSPGIDPAYPALLEGGAFQAMRYMTLWPLQVAYEHCPADGERYRAPEAMSRDERAVFDQVAADFARTKPKLLIIDHFADIAPCAGKAFEFDEYFLRHPVFAAEFSRYVRIGDIDRFTLWARLD
jgi:hypothetical protein